MGTYKLLLVVAVLLSFVTGLYVGMITGTPTQVSPVEDYLRKNYGVSSVEELIAKYRQEALTKIADIMPNTRLPNLDFEVPTIGNEESHYIEAGSNEYKNMDMPIASVAIIIALLVSIVNGMKGRKRKEVAMLVLLLLAGFMMGILMMRVVMAQSTTQRTWISRYTQGDWDVMVFRDGDYAVAVDRQWHVIAKSTDHASVIQAAIDALTPGRTWEEKVVLKGKFLLTEGILLPSFTVIEGGELVNRGIKLENGATHVIVKGVRIINAYKNGIEAPNVTECIFSELFIDNPYNRGIYLYILNGYPEDVVIEKCIVHNAQVYDGIQISGKRIIVKSCICYGNKENGIDVHGEVHGATLIGNILRENNVGIHIKGIREGGTTDVSIIGNIFIANEWYNIKIHDEAGFPVKNVVVEGSFFNGSSVTRAGICISSDHANYNIERVVITNNIFTNHARSGVWITGAYLTRHIIIKNNVSFNDSVSTALLTRAGLLIEKAVESVIEGNFVLNSQGRGIYISSGAVNNSLLYNTVLNSRQEDYLISETLRRCTGNVGYTTENSGYVSATNGTWVAHGLVGTPTGIQLTVEAFNVTAYVIAKNSTHFMIGLAYLYGGGAGKPVTTPVTVYWQAKYEP